MTCNLALIGAGKWGRNFIRTIGQLENITLKFVVSRNPETDQLITANTTRLADWKELIEFHDQIDGVIVATPPHVRLEIINILLKNKIPVLAEKPLGLINDDISQVIELSRKQNVPLMVDYIYLYSPAYRKLKQEIAERNDPITSLDFRSGNNGPVRENYSGLWDYAPHDLAIVLDLMKTFPLEIKLNERQRDLSVSNRLSCNFELVFLNNVKANIFLGNNFEKKERLISITTTKGKYKFDDTVQDKLYYEEDGKNYAIPFELHSPLEVAVLDFCRVIMQKEWDANSLLLTLDIQKILVFLDS